MATAVQVDHPVTLTSSAGGVAVGPEIRAGGNPVVVQFAGPAALAGLEGSFDKLNWVTLDDENGVAIATLDNAVRVVTRAPKWVRPFVAIDAGGPRTFLANIGVVKESA